jgi:branched-subunit amino acid transport protein AzlD
VTGTWVAIIVGAVIVYLVKLSGLTVPKSLLERERVRSLAMLLPMALLAALVAVQTFSDGRGLVLDHRAGGLAVALVAVALRAPLLAVVVLAAGTTAVLRLIW